MMIMISQIVKKKLKCQNSIYFAQIKRLDILTMFLLYPFKNKFEIIGNVILILYFL